MAPLWGDMPFARLVKLGSGAFAKGAESLNVTQYADSQLSPCEAQAPTQRGECHGRIIARAVARPWNIESIRQPPA